VAPPRGKQIFGPDFENGRDDPPSVRLMLAQWRGIGTAKVIGRPIGAFTQEDGDANVLVHNFTFKPSLVSIPRVSSLTWRFRDNCDHDATVVCGPRVRAEDRAQQEPARDMNGARGVQAVLLHPPRPDVSGG
jgi:hypothetical protein